MEGLERMKQLLEYYRGKKVLITGHTGFKGSYLTRILILAGAEVTGYSLAPPTDPSLFAMLGMEADMRSVTGDVRDYEHLLQTVLDARPEIVFHLAAQPLVRESYRIPRETFETNVMGTVNLLEALRLAECARSVVNVTTDKVYLNLEEERPYREDDPLDGYDPYSNSKSCSDLVTHSYRKSFFREKGIPVSTARAGNVIGGGDFAKDRIVPDCVRACEKGEPIAVRNPNGVRPFQHVLEPLSAYLLLAKEQESNIEKAGAYNVGPESGDTVTAGELAELFAKTWGEGASCVYAPDGGPHEAALLMLDSTKIKESLGWKPVWNIRTAIEKTVEWAKGVRDGESAAACTDRQIREYYHV